MKTKKMYAKMCVCFIFFTMIFLVMPSTLQAGQLIVHVGIDPPTVPVGQPTEIRVEVLSAPGTPLPGAHVEISAGGGVFLDSGGTVVGGQTGGNGMYATPWKCDQCASAYVFGIEVNKQGFQGWKGEATVHITTQPSPGPGSQIFANVSANPPVISKAHPTVVRVEAFSDTGNPIPGAHVKISAGGGFFIDSNNRFVEGHTEANGLFETPWKCIQCAPAYVFDIEVNKPGFKGWKGETKVEITSQPGPVQGGPININASTHPATVSKGQPTDIRVEAISDQGHPIPDAHVKISAGGGVFLDAKGLVIEGQTDINGIYVTPWKCVQCAPAYVFDIEVTKPGFDKGKAEAKVNIKSQASPNPPLPPKSLPDLAISSVKIYPSQPFAGQKFTVAVYVTNKGNAVSGQYDLAMYMKDVGRGHTYPVGTFRRNAMKPGEQIPWQKQNLMVNFPGSYQYWVEITPFLFKDLDNNNNKYGRAFTVK